VVARLPHSEYVFETSSSRRPASHFSKPAASIAAKVIPSTPGAPALERASAYACAGCLPGKSCRRAGRSRTQARPSPYDTAFSEGSGSLSVLPGSSKITVTSPSSKAHQKSGSFAQLALPSFNTRTTCPTPPGPAPVATLRLLPSPMTGLPRLPEPPFRRAVPTTPADRAGACVDYFPAHAGSSSAIGL